MSSIPCSKILQQGREQAAQKVFRLGIAANQVPLPRGVTEPDAAAGAEADAAIACEFACAVCFVGFLNLRMSRPRQYSMVLANPSRNCTLGSQPRCLRALVISGLRCLGSSPGSGRWMIFDLEPTCLMHSSASCLIVNSPGLPMFTGPMVCCPDEGGADASKQQATPLGARLCRSGGWNRAPAAHLLVHQPDEPVD